VLSEISPCPYVLFVCKSRGDASLSASPGQASLKMVLFFFLDAAGCSFRGVVTFFPREARESVDLRLLLKRKIGNDTRMREKRPPAEPPRKDSDKPARDRIAGGPEHGHASGRLARGVPPVLGIASFGSDHDQSEDHDKNCHRLDNAKGHEIIGESLSGFGLRIGGSGSNQPLSPG